MWDGNDGKQVIIELLVALGAPFCVRIELNLVGFQCLNVNIESYLLHLVFTCF